MLARDLRPGDLLWTDRRGWEPVQSVLRLAPIRTTAGERRMHAGVVEVAMGSGAVLRYAWNQAAHTAAIPA